MKKIAFHTLGCKLNFSETSTISRSFSEGYKQVDFNEIADIYVINTCSVTQATNKKCRDIIKKAHKLNPDSYIAVIGCYAQLKPEEIFAIEGVDIVLGNSEKYDLIKYIEASERLEEYNHQGSIITTNILKEKKFNSSFSYGDRTRSFLKVQDGCDYFCSYCTIPFARGTSRSSTISEILDNTKEIESNGIKEIILTGINVGDFGKGTDENLFQLLKALDDNTKFERIRLSSIEPNLLTDEIIDLVRTSKRIMPHFHIPLQSGSDLVLKDMRRKYSTELFKDRVDKIKSLIPHAFIGVDVIVGFPTESEIEFEKTYKFIDSLDISFLHVFTYSERENTDALKFKEKVPERIRKSRSMKIHVLSDEKYKKFVKCFIGSKRFVLFEKTVKNNIMYGFTDNYIKVSTNYKESLENKINLIDLKNFDEKQMIVY